MKPRVNSNAVSPSPAAGIDHDSDLAHDLVNAQPHLMWTAGPDGEIEFRNDRWHDFAGEAGETTRWTAILHPAERALAWVKWQHHLASGDPYEAEHRLRRHDGAYRWALARAVAVRGDNGAIVRWCGTFTDIHAFKANEARLELQACELAHRMGNIFAVVQSMLMLSSRNQPEAREFVTDACTRIQALAQANTYIHPQRRPAPDGLRPATLHGLLNLSLAPYQPGTDEKMPPTIIALSGPDVTIGTSAATLLALVIHELATNAAKFGALACAGGRLTVVTELDKDVLRLAWTETGGPALTGSPTRCGFGSILTDRALRLPLAAKVERIWAATGLIVTISMPCARLAH